MRYGSISKQVNMHRRRKSTMLAVIFVYTEIVTVTVDTVFL